MEREKHHRPLTLGAAAAAVLSACFGCFAMAIATVLSATFPTFKEFLFWYEPAGSLSGESGVGVLAWLISWAFLHAFYKTRETTMVLPTLWAMVFLGAALILLLPPVYRSF